MIKNGCYFTAFTDSLFPFFSFFKFTFVNLKPLLYSIQRDVIVTSLFRKLAKVATNNFKMDI